LFRRTANGLPVGPVNCTDAYVYVSGPGMAIVDSP
jgi:hypothetical protein